MEKFIFLLIICTSVHAQKNKSLDSISSSQLETISFTKEFKNQVVDGSFQMSDGSWLKNGAIVVMGNPSAMYEMTSGSTGIPIGAFNLPRGSVLVKAGDLQLQEGTDYTVNYQAGTVQILDPSFEASNLPIIISY